MNGDELMVGKVESFLTERAERLIREVFATRSPTGNEDWAGWYNNLPADRLGSIGTALPMLFLESISKPIPRRDEIVNYLLAQQTADGAWNVRSIPDTATVDATSWALRALVRVGDNRSWEAVARAKLWLVNQQKADGSWGPTKLDSNVARTITTVRALQALSCLSEQPRGSIDAGVSWLKSTQRRDGSWAPIPDRPSTTVHTALALQALLQADVPPSDSRVVQAVDYLKSSWNPPDKVVPEPYHVYQNATRYVLQEMSHRTDDEVVLALALARKLDAFPKLLAAVKHLTQCQLPTGKTTIWDVVQPAMAAAAFLRQLPMTGEGMISLVGQNVVLSQKRPALFRALLRQVFRRRRPRLVVLALTLTVPGYMIVRYVRGESSLETVWTALILPIALVILERFYDAWKRKQVTP